MNRNTTNGARVALLRDLRSIRSSLKASKVGRKKINRLRRGTFGNDGTTIGQLLEDTHARIDRAIRNASRGRLVDAAYTLGTAKAIATIINDPLLLEFALYQRTRRESK